MMCGIGNLINEDRNIAKGCKVAKNRKILRSCGFNKKIVSKYKNYIFLKYFLLLLTRVLIFNIKNI